MPLKNKFVQGLLPFHCMVNNIFPGIRKGPQCLIPAKNITSNPEETLGEFSGNGKVAVNVIGKTLGVFIGNRNWGSQDP